MGTRVEFFLARRRLPVVIPSTATSKIIGAKRSVYRFFFFFFSATLLSLLCQIRIIFFVDVDDDDNDNDKNDSKQRPRRLLNEQHVRARRDHNFRIVYSVLFVPLSLTSTKSNTESKERSPRRTDSEHCARSCVGSFSLRRSRSSQGFALTD